MRMRIRGEMCQRVERESDLRASVIVYTKCFYCPGSFHRGMLFQRAIRSGVAGWELLPPPRHAGSGFLVADSSVAMGYVWRVLDQGGLSRLVARLRRRPKQQATQLDPSPVKQRDTEKV